MRNKRLKRIEKLSRLLEGGFDGSIGSEKYTSILNQEAEARHSDDLDKVQYSGEIKGSFLPYDSEGFEEDVNIYILDERFFGKKEDKSRDAAIMCIEEMFNTRHVNFTIDSNETNGIRNSNPSNDKSFVLNSIDKILLRNDSAKETGCCLNFDNTVVDNNSQEESNYLNADEESEGAEKDVRGNNDCRESDKILCLTEDQMFYLEHLKKSIERSQIPFFLYIFDPLAPENININGIKHDAMHILKDIVDLDEGVAAKRKDSWGKWSRPSQYDSQTSHPIGFFYRAIYDKSRSLGNSLMKILQDTNNYEGRERRILIPEKSYFRRRYGPELTLELTLRFFKKFFFKKIKGFRDDSIFVDKSWTADSIHDIMQSLLFSDVDMNEKVIQYEIPDENKMFQSLKLLIGYEPSLNYDQDLVLSKIKARIEKYINSLKDLRKMYLDEGAPLEEKMSKKYNKPYFEEYNKVVRNMEWLEGSISGRSKAKEEKTFLGVKPPNLSPRNSRVKRRLKFLSKGKDSVYCFIRINKK